MYWIPPTWQSEQLTDDMMADGRVWHMRMGPGPDALLLVAYKGTTPTPR